MALGQWDPLEAPAPHPQGPPPQLANVYLLYKERGSDPLDTRIPHDSSNKASFLTEARNSPHLRERQGQHPSDQHLCVCLSILLAPQSPSSAQLRPQGEDALCPTLKALLCLRLSVGLRTPVQAETLPKPTIWAEPGPVIPSGSPMTICCQGTRKAKEYLIYKEGSPAPWKEQKSLKPGDKAKFSITRMTERDAGRYRCYYLSPTGWSGHSDPLELVVTGSSSKPSLSALPSPVVSSGGNVTLQCGSGQGFDRFILTKEGDHRLSWALESQPQPSGQYQALFRVGPVTRSHRGTFRCYGCYRNRLQVWSHPSDALELLVSGMYTKPSLSAQPGPSVPWGATVTLQCVSEIWLDTFHLHREGSLDPPQHLSLQDTFAPSQANFTLNSVSSGHQGTYRCYGSHSTSPYLLSQPSDPLELLVS
ncbi:PREDICTED: leukocyte immunoglobulin-like receptor subfamily A member 5, partial [Myotis brandtii]|uniref:leukocyte immunoglobulin-like receptor subfamily A member 5 n=1 Tax=Myotis brandtii TaxID=109478 RepID=UPI00070422B4